MLLPAMYQWTQPTPRVAGESRARGDTIDTLKQDLGRLGIELATDARRRAEYSFDASNYRVPPQGVVFPRDANDVVTIVRGCAERAVPLTSRGGGTSLAGNAIGPGIVMDFSRHMNRVHVIDTANCTALVDPGVVLTDLQKRFSWPPMDDSPLRLTPRASRGRPLEGASATTRAVIIQSVMGGHQTML
jgi:hypothetical protein